MADVFTGAYGFTQPEIGGSPDTWGSKLNNNWGSVDGILADFATMLSRFVGMVAPFPATGSVPGWLKLDGALVSRTTYSDLYDFATTTGVMAATEGGKKLGEFGPGDGSTTFSLPDVRGYVIRALDDSAGVDVGRVAGSTQDSQNRAHIHTASSGDDGHSHSGSVDADGIHSHSGSIGSNGNHRHSITTHGDSGEDYRDRVSNYATLRYTGTGYTNYDGSHSHSLTINNSTSHTHSYTTDTHTHNHAITVDSQGGAEARMKNVAFAYYIKF